MSDFGFVGAAYQAPSLYQDDQECINWYPEIDVVKPQGSRGVIALYPTPGLLAYLQSPTTEEVRGLYTITGGAVFFAVVGQNLFRITPNLIYSIVGKLLTSVGQVSMKDNGVSLYLCDGPTRYACALNGTGFTTIADGAFIGANKIDIIDNFFVYNNPFSNQWGATSALSTASPALSFGSTDSTPDILLSLIVNLREVFLLKEKTSEVWIDAGLFPFPFQRLSGASLQHGCAAIHSIARLGESFAFLSADDRGRGVVIQMVGYSPKRISTHAVETDIANGTIADAIAFSYQQAGHEFYVLTFPIQDKTWVFDLATELWHKRAYRDNLNVLHRHRANCCTVFQGNILVGDYANGMIYKLDLGTYTDNGMAIPRIRRCIHLTNELKRQFFSDLQIQFQPGVGLATGQGSDPQAMLRWSDDGGSTWSSDHWASIGKMGIYKSRAIWRRLGSARDRIFEVVITDQINPVVISAELNANAGEH